MNSLSVDNIFWIYFCKKCVYIKIQITISYWRLGLWRSRWRFPDPATSAPEISSRRTRYCLFTHKGDYPTLLVVLDPTSLLGRSSVGVFHKLLWLDLLFHLADCGFHWNLDSHIIITPIDVVISRSLFFSPLFCSTISWSSYSTALLQHW